eukprot:30143-Hanusia_phi.AAC.3
MRGERDWDSGRRREDRDMESRQTRRRRTRTLEGEEAGWRSERGEEAREEEQLEVAGAGGREDLVQNLKQLIDVESVLALCQVRVEGMEQVLLLVRAFPHHPVEVPRTVQVRPLHDVAEDLHVDRVVLLVSDDLPEQMKPLDVGRAALRSPFLAFLPPRAPPPTTR